MEDLESLEELFPKEYELEDEDFSFRLPAWWKKAALAVALVAGVTVLGLLVGKWISGEQEPVLMNPETTAPATEATAAPTRPDPYRQLTEQELAGTTEELVDVILGTVWPMEFLLSSSTEGEKELYQRLSQRFNGFRELESRSDAGAVLLEKFQAYQSSSAGLRYGPLQHLLKIPVYQKNLTDAEMEQLRQLGIVKLDPYRQLTQAELAGTTEELVDAILDTGWAGDMFVSEPVWSSSLVLRLYSEKRVMFNGFRELETRPDAGTVLLQKYRISVDDTENRKKRSHLRSLLEESVYQQMMTDAEMELLEKLLGLSDVIIIK